MSISPLAAWQRVCPGHSTQRWQEIPEIWPLESGLTQLTMEQLVQRIKQALGFQPGTCLVRMGHRTKGGGPWWDQEFIYSVCFGLGGPPLSHVG